MCTPLLPSFVADANLMGNVKTAEEIIFVQSRFEIVVVVVASVVVIAAAAVVVVEDFERLNCHEVTS